MPTPSGPHFRDLSREECEAILARNNVGRIAYAHAARVDIEPINYVYADGWIYCRTSRGAKVAIIEHQPWVAFEVDEVTALFDWRSVVVRGAHTFWIPARPLSGSTPSPTASSSCASSSPAPAPNRIPSPSACWSWGSISTR